MGASFVVVIKFFIDVASERLQPFASAEGLVSHIALDVSLLTKCQLSEFFS
jgi:hypothetical protein